MNNCKCGSGDVFIVSTGKRFFVECSDCKAKTKNHVSQRAAVGDWDKKNPEKISEHKDGE